MNKAELVEAIWGTGDRGLPSTTASRRSPSQASLGRNLRGGLILPRLAWGGGIRRIVEGQATLAMDDFRPIPL